MTHRPRNKADFEAEQKQQSINRMHERIRDLEAGGTISVKNTNNSYRDANVYVERSDDGARFEAVERGYNQTRGEAIINGLHETGDAYDMAEFIVNRFG